MARDFSLSFRQDPIGGDIDLGKAWFDLDKLKGLSRLVFLIHGYNNTLDDAERAYGAFFDSQERLAGDGRDWAFDAAVVRVFWPGDAKWGRAAPAYYPWAVTRAQEDGWIFASMLVELSRHSTGILHLHFVAHSLGNRVLLRALADLGSNPRIHVRRTVHMAAAVPTWKLADDPRDRDVLAKGLEKETGAESHAKSLYSGADMVLAWAFPFGETFSPEADGILPAALGHEYWGEGVLRPNLSQWEARGAGHSDYWGAEKETPAALSDWVAATARDELALNAAGTRRIAGSLPMVRPASGAREQDARVTNARTVLPDAQD